MHALKFRIILSALAVALATPSLACVGDCNGDGVVTVAELITGVNLALDSSPTTTCQALDANGDDQIVVNELIAAVSNAAVGCPLVTPTATAVPTATPSTGSGETRCTVPDGDGVNFTADQPFCDLLSSYRFFRDGPQQQPNDGVLPYDLNTPLFSDYALKRRFVWLPPGTSATYSLHDSFKFPVGSVLIKTFAFPRDERDASLGERLIETRLLVHRTDKWEAITYLWNDQQTDAKRLIIGKAVAISYPTADGGTFTDNYQVPNTNQCKECHAEHDDVLGPLGPKARQLNKDYAYADGTENELTRWTTMGYLTGAPADPTAAPKLPVFNDPSTGTVEERSRAYFDANCGHCHNPTGLARTSGLYLNIDETTPGRYGVCKAPVAAGQGSGGRRVDILPGNPDGSILIYRMQSVAPGVAMPELGRQKVHEEAVDLISQWISSLTGNCD